MLPINMVTKRSPLVSTIMLKTTSNHSVVLSRFPNVLNRYSSSTLARCNDAKEIVSECSNEVRTYIYIPESHEPPEDREEDLLEPTVIGDELDGPLVGPIVVVVRAVDASPPDRLVLSPSEPRSLGHHACGAVVDRLSAGQDPGPASLCLPALLPQALLSPLYPEQVPARSCRLRCGRVHRHNMSLVQLMTPHPTPSLSTTEFWSYSNR